jgi:glycosyltransferase involved in cell wall biosynthesis
MKVSIIIPAYNEEHFIADAIQASLTQDYKKDDLEIIVVDNGSTDKTAEIVRQFPVTLIHESRKGSLYARNAGYLKARGEIIVNLDADCLPDTNWISKGIAIFKKAEQKHPDLSAVSGPYYYYDNGKLFGLGYFFIHAYIQPVANYFLQKIKMGAVVMGGNVFIRRTTLQKIGGYDVTIEFWGDDSSTAKSLAKVGFVHFDSKLVIRASAKRFKEQGTIPLTARYFYHFLKSLLNPNRRNLNNSAYQCQSDHR